MIDYAKVQAGDKLRITGMGAPGFAKLGDIVTVEKCTPANHGRCDVVHDVTGEKAYFALTCGAERLEPAPEADVFLHFMPKADACEHDFQGWREFADGRGGERVCAKCGMGAMAHTLSLDI